jgi:5-methyltetrahydrofolate--homocysteine methyltransferase
VAAQLAREAAPGALIAGSIGPSGRLLAPLGDLDPAGAADGFALQAQGLVAGRVDLAWIETMADVAEVAAAVQGVRRVDPTLPIAATLVFDARGRTMMGTTPEQAAAALLELGVVAIGANCGDGPEPVELAVGRLRVAAPGVPIVAKANAGLPITTADGVAYPATPREMAQHARRALSAGATVVGGCCGTTAAHIQAIAEALIAEGED